MGFASLFVHPKGAFITKAYNVAEQMWGASPLSWPVWQPGAPGKQALKEALDWSMGERQKHMDLVDAQGPRVTWDSNQTRCTSKRCAQGDGQGEA